VCTLFGRGVLLPMQDAFVASQAVLQGQLHRRVPGLLRHLRQSVSRREV